jgi:hypothetical protein
MKFRNYAKSFLKITADGITLTYPKLTVERQIKIQF